MGEVKTKQRRMRLTRLSAYSVVFVILSYSSLCKICVQAQLFSMTEQAGNKVYKIYQPNGEVTEVKDGQPISQGRSGNGGADTISMVSLFRDSLIERGQPQQQQYGQGIPEMERRSDIVPTTAPSSPSLQQSIEILSKQAKALNKLSTIFNDMSQKTNGIKMPVIPKVQQEEVPSSSDSDKPSSSSDKHIGLEFMRKSAYNIIPANTAYDGSGYSKTLGSIIAPFQNQVQQPSSSFLYVGPTPITPQQPQPHPNFYPGGSLHSFYNSGSTNSNFGGGHPLISSGNQRQEPSLASWLNPEKITSTLDSATQLLRSTFIKTPLNNVQGSSTSSVPVPSIASLSSMFGGGGGTNFLSSLVGSSVPSNHGVNSHQGPPQDSASSGSDAIYSSHPGSEGIDGIYDPPSHHSPSLYDDHDDGGTSDYHIASPGSYHVAAQPAIIHHPPTYQVIQHGHHGPPTLPSLPYHHHGYHDDLHDIHGHHGHHGPVIVTDDPFGPRKQFRHALKVIRDSVSGFHWNPITKYHRPVKVFTVLGSTLDHSLGGAWAARRAIKKGIGSVVSSKVRLGGTIAYVGSEILAKAIDVAVSV